MEEYILTHGSYLGIVLLLTLAGAGLPIPEEIPVVAAGVLSSPSVARLDPLLAFAACLAGAIIGDSVMYGIGRFLGKAYLRDHPWFGRLLHAERERQMESLVRQNGLKMFLLARFLVGVRSPIYLAAGVLRIPYRRFLLVDATCATLVVGTFFWSSHFFGAWIGPLFRESQMVVTLVILVLLVGVGMHFLWKKYLSLDPQAHGQTLDPPPAPTPADEAERHSADVAAEPSKPKPNPPPAADATAATSSERHPHS